MGGCLWSFLPFPILIALYYIIRQPIVYFMSFGGKVAGQEVVTAAKELIESAGITLTSNAAYEQIEISNIINSNFPDFITQHPGWVNVNYTFLGLDLSATPLSIIKSFTFSWACVGLILIPILAGGFQLLMTKVSMSQQPSNPSTASTKSMMYMMPLFSVYIAFMMPGALGIYWIAQSAFSLVQEIIMNKFYNKKLEEEENARYEARQADRQRRQEEAKRLQQERKQQTEKKQSLKEKQKAAQAAKAAKAAKAGRSTTEAGRVGDRPYARGRAYKADRYGD
jgi:YidC/Oxa1 family membrane protein insertase